jgi:hypothetical protein
MDNQFKKINSVYNQTITFCIIFLLVSSFTLVFDVILDRFSSSLFFILSLSGLIAFIDDKKRWKKNRKT